MSLVVVFSFLCLGYAMPRYGLRLTTQLGLGDLSVGALALTLGVSAFLAPVVVFGRLSGSSEVGWIGAAVISAGLVFAFRGQPGPRPIVSQRRAGFYLAMAVALLVITRIALEFQLHDENFIIGHRAIAEQIAHGAFPPSIPWLPGEPLGYHWGFDVLAGALRVVAPISSALAIDLVSIFLALSLAWVSAALVQEAGGSGAAAVWAIFFGAGLALWVMLPQSVPAGCQVQFLTRRTDCGVGLFPSQLLNFFQHAVSLGAPLFFTWVLLAPRLHRCREHPLLAWSVPPLLLSLGVGQAVFFAVGVLAALVSAPLWWRGSQAKRGWAWLLCLCGLGAVLVFFSGAMFTPSPHHALHVDIRKHIGYHSYPDQKSLVKNILHLLYYYTANLGLGFVLMPWFAFEALRRRQPMVVMLLAFSIGGILVQQIFVYETSWDIVKFPSASAFALSLLCVIVLHRRLRQPGLRWVAARLLFWLLLIPTGTTAAARLLVHEWDTTKVYLPGTEEYPQTQALARFFDRGPYQPDQILFSMPSSYAKELAVLRGSSIAHMEDIIIALGFKIEDLAELKSLEAVAKSTMEQARFTELGVRWLVIADDAQKTLSPEAKAALADPTRYRPVARVDELQLWWNLAFPFPPGWPPPAPGGGATQP